jgi:hypothetical protein
MGSRGLDNDVIHQGSVNYGSITLFQAVSFSEANAKKAAIRKKLNARRRCFGFSQFMTGQCLAISVGVFCLITFFATLLPAVVSLLMMKLYQPEKITYDNITLLSNSQAVAVTHRRDINLLWAALAFSIAAVVGMFLYCILSGLSEHMRDKKINTEQLLAMLKKNPDLNSDATAEAIQGAMSLLAEVEAKLDLSHDIESESAALVRQGMRQ